MTLSFLAVCPQPSHVACGVLEIQYFVPNRFFVGCWFNHENWCKLNILKHHVDHSLYTCVLGS